MQHSMANTGWLTEVGGTLVQSGRGLLNPMRPLPED